MERILDFFITLVAQSAYLLPEQFLTAFIIIIFHVRFLCPSSVSAHHSHFHLSSRYDISISAFSLFLSFFFLFCFNVAILVILTTILIRRGFYNCGCNFYYYFFYDHFHYPFFFSFSVYALAVTLQIFYMLIKIFERWFWMVCPLIIHFVLKFLQISLNFPRDSP